MKKVILSFIMVSLFIFTVGCAQGEKSSKELSKITVSETVRFLGYLPAYVAVSKGFFEEEGLDVEITTAGGDSQAFSSVIGGSADFAIADPMMVAISKDKGGPGVNIGMIVNKIPFVGIAKDKNITEITDPSQFKGKTIVTFPAPMTNYTMLVKTLRQASLQEEKDVKIIQAAFGTEFGPLEAGNADIAMTLEPIISQGLVKQGYHSVYRYAEVWGNFAFTGLMTSEEYIKDHPEKVQAFMNGIQKAMKYAKEDLNGSVEVAKEWFPDLDEEVLKSAIENLQKDDVWPENTAVDADGWNKHAEVRVELGDLSKAISVEEGANNTFATEAFNQYGEK